LFYSRNDTTLTDLKVSLFHSSVNICVPDKLQRSPLKPSIQPYVQFPSNLSHILLIHVSQCDSQFTPYVPVLHSAKKNKYKKKKNTKQKKKQSKDRNKTIAKQKANKSLTFQQVLTLEQLGNLIIAI